MEGGQFGEGLDRRLVIKSIAIIPARGGSKRIPNKNIVDFDGDPMIAKTIRAAIESGEFEKIVVSTDSEEIADISLRFGADVPFLRDEAADDLSAVSLASIATLKQAEEHWGTDFDEVTQLMANCPLRSADTIKRFLADFRNKTACFQISCFRFGWMNPNWAFEMPEPEQPKYLFPDRLASRSQDLPALFCPTGAIWTATAGQLKKEKTFYGRNHSFFEIGWKEAVDIDDYDDLELAIAIAAQVKNSKQESRVGER